MASQATPLPNREFGALMVVVLLVVGLWDWRHGVVFLSWPMISAAVVVLVTLLRPSLLSPATRAWLMVGQLLHRIVSPLTLGMIFFGIITPMAAVMRMARRDILLRRFDPEASTYWIERPQTAPQADSFFKQF